MKRWLPYVATGFFFLFVIVACMVHGNNPSIHAFDVMIQDMVRIWQTPQDIITFKLITFLGGAVGVVIGTVAVMWFFRHRPDIIARFLIALVGSAVSLEYLKTVIGRVRPDSITGLVIPGTYSFPSGHANAALVLYGFLALLLYVHARGPISKVLSLAIPSVLIAFVGLSRIVLDYHYASDVLGGYLFGVFWLMLALSLQLANKFYHERAIDPTVL